MLDRKKKSPAMRRLLGGLAILAAMLLAACEKESEKQKMANATQITQGGDPYLGREKVREYGCGTCHTVPGVRGARGQVGPPLVGISGRMYVAGLLPNNPDNLMQWILDPPSVDPKTAMPNVGVTKDDARHIAAYLYTLK